MAVSGEADRTWLDEMTRVYRDVLVPVVFTPFAVELARRVVAVGPRRVLEIAAGTGALTEHLVGTVREVVATDLNQAMVDAGERVVPVATWRQADAMALPFDDGGFDVVACQFGAMFFPDRPRAFGEMRRVLVDGGVTFVSVWDAIDTHGWEVLVDAALARALPDDPPAFFRELPHGYADAQRIVADVAAAGFTDVTVERVAVESVAESVPELARGYCFGTPVRAQIESRGGDLDEVARVVTEALVDAFGSGPATTTMSALVVTARR